MAMKKNQQERKSVGPTTKVRLNTLEVGLDELVNQLVELRARVAVLEEMVTSLRIRSESETSPSGGQAPPTRDD